MIPGVVVAGTHSGAGKTTVALGIMSLLVKGGYRVQGFKVGPDYIDPSFYKGITGRAGENLDIWMTSPEAIRRIYREAGAGAELAVVEGVMGLYDGARGDGETGSTAQIAKILGLPVILVVDAHGMARSAAAVIKGFTGFDPGVRFGGIVFNRVGGERHRRMLFEAAKGVTGVRVLGYLTKDAAVALPERHLGLVPFYENPDFPRILEKLAVLFENAIDPVVLKEIFNEPSANGGVLPPYNPKQPSVRIGIARDEAFGFYYEDNLRMLQREGAELVGFSPLRDCHLPPDLGGLYIGGGYPELFAGQLAANISLKTELAASTGQGMPVYAECGGLMYLGDQLKTPGGEYPMAGILPLKLEMTSKREALGYAEVTAVNDNLLLKKGQTARGHEFHYSRIVYSGQIKPAYSVNSGGTVRQEGFVKNNLLASYIHLHFASNPETVRSFVARCREFKGGSYGH